MQRLSLYYQGNISSRFSSEFLENHVENFIVATCVVMSARNLNVKNLSANPGDEVFLKQYKVVLL